MTCPREAIEEYHKLALLDYQRGRRRYEELVRQYGHSEVHRAWTEWRKGQETKG